MNNYRIGGDIHVGSNLLSTIIYAKKAGYNIMQLFIVEAGIIPSKKDNIIQLKKLGQELIKNDIKLVIHGSYKINLCHPPDSSKFKSSVRLLVQDLNANSIIGNNCLGVIIHMGKNVPEIKTTVEGAIQNYANGIKYVLSKTSDSNIILETGASQGTEVGSDINGLSTIYNLLSNDDKKRVFFCIDTCHIWATGYDISNKNGVDGFFEEFDNKIGIDKILCIHFNDSRNTLGSHVDRHDDLGYGNIGSIGLKYFAQTSKKYRIPLITETPLRNINQTTNKELTQEDELKLILSWTKKIE